MLRIAAEVEHALMVEYLYAAFTLGIDADPKYRRFLVTIAKQEMGHFVTVQNLLRLLGAPPHVDRDDLLPRSGKEPGTFALEPVTLDSLAKYVVIESPLDEEIEGSAQDFAAYKRAKKKIDAKSMLHLNRVGALYAVIYWLFMKSDEPNADEPWRLDQNAVLQRNPDLKGRHLKDEDFADAQEISAFVASRDDWRVTVSTIFVDNTIDRASAKLALFRISAQGEGVSSAPEDVSHFQRFLELFVSAEQKPPEIINIAPTKAKLLDTEAGRTVAELFNGRYQMLLLLMDLALRVPRGNGVRRTLSNLAVDEMLQGIKAIAKAMLSLAGGPTNGPVAPPFELPSGAWPKDSLPSVAAGGKRLTSLLAQSRKFEETLRSTWAGLIEEELNALNGHNASIEDAIGKLPSP